MDGIDLQADCARCAALCCVALAFDKGPQFAVDKAAGERCENLERHGCAIHADRQRWGFMGCVRYDCQGAGQRVTQDLYRGADWRDDPALTRPMSDAFVVVQRAHAMLALLRQARALPLAPAERDQIDDLERDLGDAGASPELVAGAEERARGVLKGLRRHVRQPADHDAFVRPVP